MSNTWQLQDAKSKFSELVKQAIQDGPQYVTKRGVDSVVVISITDYQKLNRPVDDLRTFFEKSPKIDLDILREADSDRDIQL
ncbi:MAG: type II toxin-antitoxin system Phd/YefM family antitoxin [Calditrichaeota bacterium]|nr:type II toxin-antitoxin system Phd/YefM family antitoxin [Calditrichota bacterium]